LKGLMKNAKVETGNGGADARKVQRKRGKKSKKVISSKLGREKGSYKGLLTEKQKNFWEKRKGKKNAKENKDNGTTHKEEKEDT